MKMKFVPIITGMLKTMLKRFSKSLETRNTLQKEYEGIESESTQCMWPVEF